MNHGENRIVTNGSLMQLSFSRAGEAQVTAVRQAVYRGNQRPAS
jgi:hypothetical protein